MGTRVRDLMIYGGGDLLPILVSHSPDWIGEIFEVRRPVGALIAERATDDHRAELAARLAEIRAASGGDDVQMADVGFHRALACATGNRVYVLLTNTLLNGYPPVRTALVEPLVDPEAAYARLEPVVAAVQAGDGAAARTAADVYLSETELLMTQALRMTARDRHSSPL